MDTRKFLMASAAGSVALFVLGGLIYGLALKDFVNANSAITMPDQPVWWSMILSQIAMGGFVAYILGNWAKISTFAGGARAGAMIGAFIGVGIGFDLASVGMMTVTFAIVDVFLWAARFAVAGGVAGHVLGMSRGE